MESSELREMEALIERGTRCLGSDFFSVRTIGHAIDQNHSPQSPILSLRLGSSNPCHPTFALVGGIHGLERIGSQVVLSFLRSLIEFAQWDLATQSLLSRARIVAVPIANPIGNMRQTRSNGRGVDLMRNAPIDSPEPAAAWKIYRGHRISARLPWYRGIQGQPLESENQALLEWARTEIFPATHALSVDVHSGFGMVDRLWYPYASRRDGFHDAGSAQSLSQLLGRTLPFHSYRFEPQSAAYTVHGDLWDYCYDLHSAEAPRGNRYLPLTLEMGSWNWLRKNRASLFRLEAYYHPLKAHRIQRTLRRHAQLLDFLFRAAASPESFWQKRISEV